VYDNYNALAIAFGPTDRAGDIVCSITLYPKWVSLFFTHGTGLRDPERRLQGSGSRIRHVVLERAMTMNEPAVRALIREALDQAGPRPAGPGRARHQVGVEEAAAAAAAGMTIDPHCRQVEVLLARRPVLRAIGTGIAMGLLPTGCSGVAADARATPRAGAPRADAAHLRGAHRRRRAARRPRAARRSSSTARSTSARSPTRGSRARPRSRGRSSRRSCCSSSASGRSSTSCSRSRRSTGPRQDAVWRTA